MPADPQRTAIAKAERLGLKAEAGRLIATYQQQVAADEAAAKHRDDVNRQMLDLYRKAKEVDGVGLRYDDLGDMVGIPNKQTIERRLARAKEGATR